MKGRVPLWLIALMCAALGYVSGNIVLAIGFAVVVGTIAGINNARARP